MRDIFVYDEIGPDFWGLISAKTIKAELDQAKNERVRVRINSPGGDVFEGVAIYNLLRNHKPGVEVSIDALAASAASFLALAGERVEIAESAMVMIHNAWGVTIGDKAEHAKRIDLLDKVDDQIRGIYAARTKQSEDDLRAWMDAETWMTAAEAIDRGFADAIGTTNNVAAAPIKAGRYRHTPAALVAKELPREIERKRAKARWYELKFRLTKSH